MCESSANGFFHSIKVPRIYKNASVIVKKVVEEGGSLKDLVYSTRHKNLKGVYALVVETIKHSKELDRILNVTKLLEKEKGLQPWLARILITELLYGKKELKGASKPVQTILSYKSQFEKLLLKEKNFNKSINTTVNKPRYVRVNTLRFTPDEVIKIFRKEGWSFLPCPANYPEFLDIVSELKDYTFTRDFHIKELLVFPCKTQFYNNSLYSDGSIILQDKASCLPAFLLQPKPHSVVLDMCSAPGMKTTHLSAMMKNKGKIYATEMDRRRYNVLCDFIQKSGCTNVTPINVDALNLNELDNSEKFPWVDDVEYILVDPTCSGSGMVDRRNIFAVEKNDQNRIRKLCRFQFKLLMHALTSFKKVRRVVYSTCSVRPEENEGVVEDVLKKLNAVENSNKLAKFKLVEPFQNIWPRRESEHVGGRSHIFMDPEKDLTNGFFVAVFERSDDVLEVREEPELNQIEELKDKSHKRKLESHLVESDRDSLSNLDQKKRIKINKKHV